MIMPLDEMEPIIQNLVNVLGAEHEALIRRTVIDFDADAAVQVITALITLPAEGCYERGDPEAWDDLATLFFLYTGNHDGKHLTEPLLLMLEQSKGYTSKSYSARALGYTRDKSVEPHLRALLDKQPQLRNAATHGLIVLLYGNIDEAGYVKALQDEYRQVRYYAVRELDELRATEALLEALSNSDARVRRVAAWYMGYRVIRHAVDALIARLHDSDIEALRAAVWSLGMLQDQRAIPAIQPLTNHADELIARTANEAIERLETTADAL